MTSKYSKEIKKDNANINNFEYFEVILQNNLSRFATLKTLIFYYIFNEVNLLKICHYHVD